MSETPEEPDQRLPRHPGDPMPRMPRLPRKRVVRKVRKARSEIARFLRIETTGGILLLIGAALALVIANTPLSGLYEDVRHTYVGIEGFFALNVQHWASDFLLAFFFLVVGLELKRELVVGELRDIKHAMLPIVAAAGGMIVPAAVAVAIAWGEEGATAVWPVPMATDIAFAVAVLALSARALPSSLRIFLLTLAIADDIGAIAMIAILYSNPAFIPLLLFAALIGLWVFLQARRVSTLWVYIPLGLAAWVALYEADVHATIAGVALGLATRVKRDPGERHSPVIKAEHALQPFSAGFAVPVFAFFSAGVALNAQALNDFATDRVALAVVAGLFLGKMIGVTAGAWAAHKLGWGRLAPDLTWTDVAGVAILCGCGFTVSLLIAELAFPVVAQQDLIKTGVLAGSAVSAIVGAAVLNARSRAVLRQSASALPRTLQS